MVRALAPFTPFLTEHIYQLLRPQLTPATADLPDARSVHFLPFPAVQEALFDAVIERRVAVMQRVIQLGRAARERRNVSLKTPLLSLVVIADAQPLADVDSLAAYVREELNVREVVLTGDEARYRIRLEARVDWPSLGKKLKKDVQVVRKALPTLSQERLGEYQRTLVRVIGDGKQESGSSEGAPQWEAALADDMVVLLDVAPHPELVEEGLVRDLISRFQRLRKKAGLVPTDEVCMRQRVVSDPDGVGFGNVVAVRQDMFVAALRGRVEEAQEEGEVILEEEQAVGNLVVMLQLARV